jgi:hypothetical protein
MEPVNLLHEHGGEVLHRWRYERCHGSREATLLVGRLADGRFYSSLARSFSGRAFLTLPDALAFAEAERARYHAGQEQDRYGGPGPAVGEWVEREP